MQIGMPYVFLVYRWILCQVCRTSFEAKTAGEEMHPPCLATFKSYVSKLNPELLTQDVKDR